MGLLAGSDVLDVQLLQPCVELRAEVVDRLQVSRAVGVIRTVRAEVDGQRHHVARRVQVVIEVGLAVVRVQILDAVSFCHVKKRIQRAVCVLFSYAHAYGFPVRRACLGAHTQLFGRCSVERAVQRRVRWNSYHGQYSKAVEVKTAISRFPMWAAFKYGSVRHGRRLMQVMSPAPPRVVNATSSAVFATSDHTAPTAPHSQIRPAYAPGPCCPARTPPWEYPPRRTSRPRCRTLPCRTPASRKMLRSTRQPRYADRSSAPDTPTAQ